MRRVISFGLLLVLVLSLLGCAEVAPEKAIVGTWKARDTVMGIVTETTYVFREDGTGERTGLFTTAFTYRFSGEELLLTSTVITFESTDVYSWKFDGDKLILTGSKETITLVKAE